MNDDRALVTRARLHARAKELASIAGRDPAQVSQVDYEEAKRELTGEWENDRQEAKLEPIPPEQPGEVGRSSSAPSLPATTSEDQNNEKRIEMERLVQRGAGEAECDQTSEASNDEKKKPP